jgi:hypothetical protein
MAIDGRKTQEFREFHRAKLKRLWDNGDLDHHPGPRKRSLERLLRRTYEIQEDNRERERSRKAIRAIIDALAKYPTEPGHACFADCPCQISRPQ